LERVGVILVEGIALDLNGPARQVFAVEKADPPVFGSAGLAGRPERKAKEKAEQEGSQRRVAEAGVRKAQVRWRGFHIVRECLPRNHPLKPDQLF
jgi:hypothetical protein